MNLTMICCLDFDEVLQCVCLRLSAFEIPYNIDICQLETSQLWLVVCQIKPHEAPRQGQTTTIRITGLWQQNLLRVMTGKGREKWGGGGWIGMKTNTQKKEEKKLRAIKCVGKISPK